MNPAPAVQIFRKRGRPPKYNKPMADLHVKIDSELFDMLDQYCMRCGTTKQYVVTQALYQFFNSKTKPNYYIQFKKKLLQRAASKIADNLLPYFTFQELMEILATICVPHQSTLKRYLFKLQNECLIDVFQRGIEVLATADVYKNALDKETYAKLEDKLREHFRTRVFQSD